MGNESVAKAISGLKVELFDIILDDGLHEQAAQIETFSATIPFLHPGGVYLIEDVRKPLQLLEKLRALFPRYVFHLEPFAKLKPKKRLIDSNVIVIYPNDVGETQPASTVH